jgi:hypothetical protein
MKFLSRTKKFSIFGIVGALFLVITVYAFIACFPAPEPGGNCASPPPGVNYQYEAPPYSGNATVILGDDGYLWIYGSGERFGQEDCQATIGGGSEGPVQWMSYPTGDDVPAFQDLRPNDIRGACLEQDIVNVPCNFTGVDKQDLLAVSNMAFGTYTSSDLNLNGQPYFSARVLIMQLQQRL